MVFYFKSQSRIYGSLSVHIIKDKHYEESTHTSGTTLVTVKNNWYVWIQNKSKNQKILHPKIKMLGYLVCKKEGHNGPISCT